MSTGHVISLAVMSTALGTVTSPSRVSFVGTSDKVIIRCTSNFVIFSYGNNQPGIIPTTLKLQNLKVRGCQGPFSVTGWSEVLVYSVVFDSNSMAPPLTISGAAKVLIQNSKFSKNNGAGNTGVFIQSSLATPGDNTIANCEFRDNIPLTGSQSAAAVYSNDALRIINSRFFSNGDILSNTDPVLRIDTPTKPIQILIQDSIFTDNAVTNVIEAKSVGQLVKVNIEGNTQMMFNQDANAIIAADNAVIVNISYTASLWQNTKDGFSCLNSADILKGDGTSVCGVSCSPPTKLDTCYVCSGDANCLGCDGIPFSTNPCPISDSDQDGNNDTTDSVAQWNGTSPNPRLFPSRGASQFVDITFGTIEERTPSGSAVRTVVLNRVPWFITVQPSTDFLTYERDYSYYATDGSNFTLQILETLFRRDANVTSGIVSFTVAENSLKYALVIRSWPYQSPANSLVFTKQFEISEAVQTESSTTRLTNNNFSISSLTFGTANTIVKVNLQQFAVLDNVTRAITVNRIGSSLSFEFVFPLPFESCTFDPDFGIVITTKDGGDGGGNNTPLIVGLTVGLVGFAILVVVLVILVVVILVAWKSFIGRARAGSSMVNFSSTYQGDTI